MDKNKLKKFKSLYLSLMNEPLDEFKTTEDVMFWEALRAEYEELEAELGFEKCDECQGEAYFEVYSMSGGSEMLPCDKCGGSGLKGITHLEMYDVDEAYDAGKVKYNPMQTRPYNVY